MVWCRRVTSNYLSQCRLGPSSVSLYGVTRSHFVAQWRHITTLIWFKVGSDNEKLVDGRRHACSALHHYLNTLKERWFETSRWSCCVTVIMVQKTRFRYYKWLHLEIECVEICFAISQGMLLNKQSIDWWLETSWCSCGVTVITTAFRYYKWLRLQWESADVSLIQVMA